MAKMRLLGEALRNLNTEGHVAWTWVTQEQMRRCDAKEEDCEGLVNYVLSIGEVEVAAFFRELPDGRYRVSLRSKGKLDVARCCRALRRRRPRMRQRLLACRGRSIMLCARSLKYSAAVHQYNSYF